MNLYHIYIANYNMEYSLYYHTNLNTVFYKKLLMYLHRFEAVASNTCYIDELEEVQQVKMIPQKPAQIAQAYMRMC